MKTNTANYRTLIVTFAEPIRILDSYFDDAEAWGVASLKEWIDGYESTRFTQTGEHTAVITSEYNMAHVKELVSTKYTDRKLCADLKRWWRFPPSFFSVIF